jgi:death-on-curing protein
MTKWLTLDHIRDICFVYAQTHLAFDEPIPPFDTRFPGKLELILGIPKQEFEGQSFYPTLTEQAAALFYSLVKEHPFLNGNKRIAVVGLLLFLLLNGKWLDIDWETFYKTTMVVAESNPQERESVLKELNKLIEEFQVEIKERDTPHFPKDQ